jgi:hypothetical protein
MAMLVVLETPTPLERAVFVLHEVFGCPHTEIAGMLDRSSASVRQLAHRAHVHARRPRYRAHPRVRREAAERFVAAALGGDIHALMEILAPDVTVWIDGGGARQAAGLRPVHGREKAARVPAGAPRTWTSTTLASTATTRRCCSRATPPRTPSWSWTSPRTATRSPASTSSPTRPSSPTYDRTTGRTRRARTHPRTARGSVGRLPPENTHDHGRATGLARDGTTPGRTGRPSMITEALPGVRGLGYRRTLVINCRRFPGGTQPAGDRV